MIGTGFWSLKTLNVAMVQGEAVGAGPRTQGAGGGRAVSGGKHGMGAPRTLVLASQARAASQLRSPRSAPLSWQC